MKTLITLAVLTNLTTGATFAFEVQGATCEEVIQRQVVRESWEAVFRGDKWTVECAVKREEGK